MIFEQQADVDDSIPHSGTVNDIFLTTDYAARVAISPERGRPRLQWAVPPARRAFGIFNNTIPNSVTPEEPAFAGEGACVPIKSLVTDLLLSRRLGRVGRRGRYFLGVGCGRGSVRLCRECSAVTACLTVKVPNPTLGGGFASDQLTVPLDLVAIYLQGF